MMECKQRVPDQEALLLEFPGFVKAVQPALDSFGSQDAVSDLLAGSREALQLRLRPGDPLAHSIFGLKQPAQGILLRLSRKAGQTQSDGPEGVQAEVVAHVKNSVRFSGMADFQYVSCDTRPKDAQAPQPAGPPGFEPEPLMCPPQLFSKQDMPLDYAFRTYYGMDPDNFKAGAALGRGVGKMAAHVINFQSLHVLQPPEQTGAAGPAEEFGLSKERRQMLRALADLFARQPIRSQQDLQESVPGLTGQEADVILPRLAYIFRNGPWKGLWVKRGYDPRIDSASAGRQALKLPGRSGGIRPKQTGAGSSTSYQSICRLSVLSEESIDVPINDIKLEAVATLVASARRQPACDVKSGWFSKEDLQSVKSIVLEHVQKLPGAARPPLPSNAAESPEQPQHNSSSQQQAHAIVPGSKTISTAGQSAQHPAVDMQSEAAVHIHAEEPAMDAPQPGHDEAHQADGSTSNAAVTQKDTPEHGISPVGYLQPDSKCSNSMKGNLEAWDGDAPAVDMSLRADQAVRAAAQEDFELYEASESDNEMMEVAGDDTGEGEDQEDD